MNKEDFSGFFDFALMVAAEIQKRDQQIQDLAKKLEPKKNEEVPF